MFVEVFGKMLLWQNVARALHRFTETANRSISLFRRNSGRKTAHTFPGIALSAGFGLKRVEVCDLKDVEMTVVCRKDRQVVLKCSRSDQDIRKTWVAPKSDRHVLHFSRSPGNGGIYWQNPLVEFSQQAVKPTFQTFRSLEASGTP